VNDKHKKIIEILKERGGKLSLYELYHLIRKNGIYSDEFWIRKALAYLHRRGLIEVDVLRQKVMVSEDQLSIVG